ANISGPPTPRKVTLGARERSACISPAPSRSPDGSPATMPMASGRSIAVTLATSAHDAPSRLRDARAERLHFRMKRRGRLEFGERLFQRTTLAVDDSIGIAERRDRGLGDTSPAHAFDVETDDARGIAADADECRHVLQHEAHAADERVRPDRPILRNAG